MAALSQDQRDYLKAIYFDPAHPASYQNPYRLYKFVRQDGRFTLTLKQIKGWMDGQETYSLNRNVVRNFQRPRVLVTGIDDQWEADLASMDAYKDDNDGYRYLLFVIDVFSRYAWVEPIKSKHADQMIAAFQQVLSHNRKPKRLRTDAGSEFTSKRFENFIKGENIFHFTTNNEKQANYAERFIQTIKRKIFRSIVSSNNPRYIDDLPKFVESYNKAFHSGIQSEPINVNQTNEAKLWWQMYWPEPVEKKKKKRKYKLEVGDLVRIMYKRTAFQREYNVRWSREIFKVKERFTRQDKFMYKITDWSDEPVKGTFYEHELQKTVEPAVWKIERIVKYKGRGRTREALVEWKGWPKKFNTWVLASTLQLI